MVFEKAISFLSFVLMCNFALENFIFHSTLRMITIKCTLKAFQVFHLFVFIRSFLNVANAFVYFYGVWYT